MTLEVNIVNNEMSSKNFKFITLSKKLQKKLLK